MDIAYWKEKAEKLQKNIEQLMAAQWVSVKDRMPEPPKGE